MLKQLLQGQVDGVVETSKKLADINSKIESLNTRVYSLENHAASSAAVKQGQLPEKAVQNPKDYCKAIFTQEEGLHEQDDNERAIEEFSIHTSPVELAQQARSSQIASSARTSQTVSARTPILLEPYQPVDPSSGHLHSQGQKEVIHKFTRDLNEIGVELPSIRSMHEAFEQMKLIQDVFDNKDKVSQLLELSTLQTNLLNSLTFLPKLADQGKFTLLMIGFVCVCDMK
ncbi:unnamed protein product [Microthlaspi erraticum]|uniref:Uncharacterized protein n=1 Tax=Microthlaspi erraticum TaxID=1685480 RepID=A0A6D2IF73_9BRAS|nr:unnamed protein product [Microthlaspi erraticum]